jgi:hypothetical protein
LVLSTLRILVAEASVVRIGEKVVATRMGGLDVSASELWRNDTPHRDSTMNRTLIAFALVSLQSAAFAQLP